MKALKHKYGVPQWRNSEGAQEHAPRNRLTLDKGTHTVFKWLKGRDVEKQLRSGWATPEMASLDTTLNHKVVIRY